MKTKRFLAVLVTCVFAFVVCAVPAMAKVIPTVPGEKASVALEVLNTDGTDCEGNIKQTAAQQSGADQSMTQQGDYITYQAENPEGYVFDSWTVNITWVKEDGTREVLGADYADTTNQKAFTAADGSTAYNPNDATLRVNYVMPQGCHTIHADAAQYENKGFELVNAAANSQEVNVTEKDGQLVADVDAVNFNVKPTIDPTEMSFSVTYVDLAGNPIGAGGRIWFDDIGVYDRENILLPYGYRAIPPAHPGEDWFYPTSLEYINGQWQVTVPDLEIVVAKSVATVNIQFALEDGTLLPDLAYEKAYFNVGGGIETVEAPEGYEIVGENTYAVDVTEDDLLNLVADPTEVTFTVKPVATTPGNPENPTDDGTTTPTQDGTMGGNPTTGDATPYVILAVTVAAAAGVMVVAFNRRKA